MEFFHILNRGVDKRPIVKDDADRLRFMQGLYLYNDKNLLNRNTRRFSKERTVSSKRDVLVYIHAFCLMDNHYHLLLSPVADETDNLSAFMRKLNMGYAKYFNERHERTGALWQGKYKKIHIERDKHFQYIPYYIHLNPLDMKFPEWRNGKLKKQKETLQFLKNYRWSSFPDYLGINNYPSLLYKAILSEILGTESKQRENIRNITCDPSLAFYSTEIEG